MSLVRWGLALRLTNQVEARLDGKRHTFREWRRVGADKLLLVVMIVLLGKSGASIKNTRLSATVF
jgi:hypothetical protein